jgi:hypothetical protein
VGRAGFGAIEQKKAAGTPGIRLAGAFFMRRLPAFVLLSLSVSIGFSACSSSEDDEPNTPESFCARWARAACSPEVVSACQAADASDCQASQVEFCLDALPAAGFSGAKADQCLDAVESAYEDADITSDEIHTVLRFAAPCDQLVRGLRAEGEECDSRSDCDAPRGFDCVFKGDTSTGTCQLPETIGAGRDCSAANAVCEAGFYCNGENCIAGEDVGDPCTYHAQCGPAGYCGLTSVCQPRASVGSSCGFDEQCASGVCYQFSATEQVCTDRLRLSRSEPICEDLR